MKISLPTTKNKKEAVICIEGDLSLKNAGQFKEKLMETLNDKDIINLKLVNVKQIDISFIQMVYALKRSFKETKKITIEHELPDELNTLITRAGIQI